MASREIVGRYSSLRVYNNMPDIISDIQRKLSKAVYTGMTVLDAYQAVQIPIDTSALANNRVIETKADGENRAISILTFNQSYAAAVHAMVGVNWKRPAAVDHWLSKAVKDNKYTILKAIKDSIRE